MNNKIYGKEKKWILKIYEGRKQHITYANPLLSYYDYWGKQQNEVYTEPEDFPKNMGKFSNGNIYYSWDGKFLFDSLAEAKIFAARKRMEYLDSIVKTKELSRHTNSYSAALYNTSLGEYKKIDKWLDYGRKKYPEFFV